MTPSYFCQIVQRYILLMEKIDCKKWLEIEVNKYYKFGIATKALIFLSSSMTIIVRL